MTTLNRFIYGLYMAAVAAVVLWPSGSRAFPPAPYHVIYGLVRDEMGQPLSLTSAQIIFETTNGVQIVGNIDPTLEPGVNYRLRLAMDLGIASDLYKPTALQPTVPFRIRVKSGASIYLPIEMSGNYANLGKPAESTRIDLTIGEDSDRDGLPDAWERLLLSMLTGKSNLSEITPEGDDDGDGLNNLDEYIAGTYAFDAEDGFRLNLIQRTGNPPLLEFLAVAQRTYTVYFSTNLQSWSQMEFALPGNGTASSLLPYYRATDTRTLQVEPVLPLELPPSKLFFKAKVQ